MLFERNIFLSIKPGDQYEKYRGDERKTKAKTKTHSSTERPNV